MTTTNSGTGTPESAPRTASDTALQSQQESLAENAREAGAAAACQEVGVSRACAYCKQDKAWIFSGKKLKDGSKIYTDETGARWSGRRCPSCERSRVYAAVRCDSFERDAIIRQFEAQGYAILSRTLPLKVEKDGKSFTVGIKRAYTDGNKIVLESPVENGQELMALVFESVRLCTPEQLDRLGPNLSIYTPQQEDII